MLQSRSVTAFAICLALFGCASPSDKDSASPSHAREGITHGPILGRIQSDSVAIWARTAAPGIFTVAYGTAPGALDGSLSIETSLDRDNTGWGTLTSLESNTKYYYEAKSGDAGEPVRGHFHTLPDAADVRGEANPRSLFNVAFEFACGNNQYGNGSAFGPAMPTYATLFNAVVREEEKNRLDFAILNGDWLYEQEREYTTDQWQEANAGVAPPEPLRVMPALAGVWENYKLYLQSENLSRWHRHVPSYFTFDDHEIVNDVYGSGEVGRRNRRAVFRDIGIKAWYDYLGWANELDVEQDVLFGRATLHEGSDLLQDSSARFDQLDPDNLTTLHVHWGTPDAGVMLGPNDSEGGDPNSRVYGIVEVVDAQTLRIEPPAAAAGEVSYSIGRRSYWRKRVANAELYFIDTRTYREMHDVNDRTADVSMLGKQQKAWLKSAMAASTADFLFVVSSVNFTIPHMGGTGKANIELTNKDDAWTVFLKEREDLIDFWDDLEKPVFVLTGDLHNSFAIKVTDRVWEFASGPHNSVNHPVSSEGNRPMNGPYDSFGRNVQIRWSSYLLPDTPNELRKRPVFCRVRVNNVFLNRKEAGAERWVAYPVPQAIFSYYDGLTGELLYAESILAD